MGCHTVKEFFVTGLPVLKLIPNFILICFFQLKCRTEKVNNSTNPELFFSWVLPKKIRTTKLTIFVRKQLCDYNVVKVD